MSVRPHVANRAESARDAVEAACSSLDEAVMVRIKTCRLTRNPQLGDPVTWLNLTLADGRELDDVAPAPLAGRPVVLPGMGLAVRRAGSDGGAGDAPSGHRAGRSLAARDGARSRRAAGDAGSGARLRTVGTGAQSADLRVSERDMPGCSRQRQRSVRASIAPRASELPMAM